MAQRETSVKGKVGASRAADTLHKSGTRPVRRTKNARRSTRKRSNYHAAASELKRGSVVAATVCVAIGGHAATSELLAHNLLAAIQSAATGAVCGVILMAVAWIIAAGKNN